MSNVWGRDEGCYFTVFSSICTEPWTRAPPKYVQRSHMNDSLWKQGWFNHYMCWHNNGEKINTARPLLLLKRQAGLKATGASSAYGLSGLQIIKAKSSDYHSLHTSRPGTDHTAPGLPANDADDHRYWKRNWRSILKGCHGNPLRPL